ncbi:bifunctional 2',3'-cyclic-nucleotide 2'-phosphodiesterase/3'-nucleotidase [Pseudomaricurvus alkylphenolicus]|uniref:bifunctional 2',3'-cyclic-nucleotide 2'-phosphodiesterase/3'-nucleotidase n=1 Tax=Pseudomaricurvus alkylphenolicus TaxID=1306991 RepID=UPI00142350A9|nr:bifunctional 2',3'-cyclic-nucleotide 2'-phosphodiesterase/3'-nucleotidase [Pseudomaricurvus alkylphenolicus]NIB42391.1 bifunctional 2',3'-cyclic-nucleotide 2'-phosphodiesterase/3'-nucleotidase [Pseudomaricurvus alkylphenolicus]
MYLRKIPHFFSIIAVLSGLSGCTHQDFSVHTLESNNPVTVSLRIIETTDIHMYFANYDYLSRSVDETVGFANTATLIKQARSEALNSVLVDNGDLLQNSPLGDYEAFKRKAEILNGKTHVAYKAMNLLDYDVGNLGNHEFNFGLEFLEASIAGANFPYINANVYHDDGDSNPKNDVNRYTPYLIQNKLVIDSTGETHTVKIGYLGFTPPQIMQWDKEKLQGKIIAKDILETARKFVPEMKKQGADLVILVPHSGITTAVTEQLAEDTALDLSKVPGVDAILFGHSHRVFPGSPEYDGLEHMGVDNTNGKLNGVPAVMPGFFGNHLGIIDMQLSYAQGKWGVVNSTVAVRAISSPATQDVGFQDLAEADSEVLAAIDTEHQATIEWLNEPFARISRPIHSFFALVQDDPSVQVVADAQIAWGKRFIQGTDLDGLPVLSAAAPFRAGRNGPADYINIAAGDIALLDTVSLYTFPNMVRMIKVSGADVKEWLERSAGLFNQIDPTTSEPQPLLNPLYPAYNFDIIDGVSYEIDVTQPARYDLDGKLVDEDSERIVNLRFNGEPIDPHKNFLIVTNNYRASGGGKFPMIDGKSRETFSGPDENRGILRRYIVSQSSATGYGGFDPSADGNWKLKTINSDVDLNLVFRTSPLDVVSEIAERMPAVSRSDSSFLDAGGYSLWEYDLN